MTYPLIKDTFLLVNMKRKFKRDKRIPPYTIPAALPVPAVEYKQLTTKQRRIIAAIKEHGPNSEAARAAHTSHDLVTKTFRLPAVQQYLREELDRIGATDEKILKVINDGLTATQRRDSFSKSGQLLKGEELPDHSERREAAKLALRLKGLDQAPDPDQAGGVTNNTIFNIVMQARAARGLEPVEATAEPAQVIPPESPAPVYPAPHRSLDLQKPDEPAPQRIYTRPNKEEKP